MTREPLLSLGLLVLRAGTGLLMATQHGLPKLLEFSERASGFADPLGLGSSVTLSLAIFAELFCACLVILGLGARLAAVPLICTMLVAAFIVHGDDPFAKKELAMLYLVPLVTLLFIGPGQYSVDRVIGRRRRRNTIIT